ncbi:MAG TPA: hypothetical protein VL280_01765 [Burkholderiales bacterium]|jgi:hypothetical protein|nr:hypothetical protein [Burkholderiales bacterium]
MTWLRTCAAIAILMLVGCASTDQLRSAQGRGEKKTYGVSFERAWNLIPYAVSDTGGKVKDRNFQTGYVMAEYGVTWTSLGERVALFCQRKGANEVEIEIVSGEGFTLSATNRAAQVFASLDRTLRP